LELIRNNNTENTSVIDLQDYLPPKVIKEMSRKDGTQFKYVKFNAGTITKGSVLQQKVGELVHWARDRDIGEDEVKSVITSKFAKVDVNVATKDNDESDSRDDPVATIVQPSIAGAKVRDKQPAKRGARPITGDKVHCNGLDATISDQSKIPKMAPDVI